MEISLARHQFPPDIIRHAVWLYLRFTLSFRDVEDLPAERGLDVCYETIRRWVLKFGPLFAKEFRRRGHRPTSKWHLDELAVLIAGRRFWLWRAVDDEGEGRFYQESESAMKLKSLLAVLSVAVIPVCTPTARANVVFDWVGTCEDNCTGTTTAVLTLTDAYVFGTPVSSSEFVSLVYQSNDQAADITSTSILMVALNADGSIPSVFVDIRDVPNFPQFQTDDVGIWIFVPNGTTPADVGNNGKFTLVAGGAIPEPSTWAMMLLGFAGLGFATRRWASDKGCRALFTKTRRYRRRLGPRGGVR
jgi:hypothetical protein